MTQTTPPHLAQLGHHSVTLMDAQGVEHVYSIPEMAAGLGFNLFLEVAAVAGRPLGLLIGSANLGADGPGRAQDGPGTAGNGNGATHPGANQSGLSGAIPGLSGADGLMDAQVDGDSLGQALRELAMGLMAKGGEQFIRRLLVGVIRDGLVYQTTPGPQRQGQWSFDQAFRANYGEMIQLVMKVADINWRPLFGGWLQDTAQTWGMTPTQPATGP